MSNDLISRKALLKLLIPLLGEKSDERDYTDGILKAIEIVSDMPSMIVAEDCVKRSDVLDLVDSLNISDSQVYNDLRFNIEDMESYGSTRELGIGEGVILKSDLLKVFEENCYNVSYDRTSVEKGMTLTGIRQVLDTVHTVNAVTLPCGLGDTLYKPCKRCSRAHAYRVASFRITESSDVVIECRRVTIDECEVCLYLASDIGDVIFRTEEEAMHALNS